MSYGNWTPKSPCDLVERFNDGFSPYPYPPAPSIKYQIIEELTKPKDELHPDIRALIPNNNAGLPELNIQHQEEWYENNRDTLTLREEVEFMSAAVAKANRHLTSSAIYVNQVTYNDLMQWGGANGSVHKPTYGVLA